MTNQVIPEAAVEAAAIAYFENDKLSEWQYVEEPTRSAIRADLAAALEAAAPHMLAGAWEAGHRTCRLDPDSIGFNPYRATKGREPEPGDGPDYHAEHAAWETRKNK